MRLRRWRIEPTLVVGEPFSTVVALAKGGDEAAAAVLYDNHVAMVYGYFRACGVIDPDDLTSEVFLGMLRGLNRFEGEQPDFRRWLMTIAHRRLVDHRRRQKSNRLDFVDPSTLEAATSADAIELFAVSVDRALIKAFAQLTEAQREVLALRFIADVSLEGVAAITERPIGAVKSLQHRGLGALRQRLGPDRHVRREA